MIKFLKKFKEKRPILSYMLVSKVLIVTSSIFMMWLTLEPKFTLFQKSLLTIAFNIILLPSSYWLTYCFGIKKEDE